MEGERFGTWRWTSGAGKKYFLTYVQNWSSPGFVGRLFLASCYLSLFILLPLHIAPFFSSLLWYFPQACMWHLLLNPTKPLHFLSNIICKIEENSQWRELVLKVNVLVWLLEIPEIVHDNNVPCLNPYTAQSAFLQLWVGLLFLWLNADEVGLCLGACCVGGKSLLDL